MTELPSPVETAPGGARLSPIVQGYWRLADWNQSAQETLAFLKAHVERGVTSVDHADIYGDYRCETLFGEALALDPSLREQIQIVTKCDIMLRSEQFPGRRTKHYDTSAGHIIQSLENSLARLGTDHVDLLLLHRPDPLMDAAEVAGAFEQLSSAGKVRHFGVSNFAPPACELLQSRMAPPISTNQVEINPFALPGLPAGTLDWLQQQRTRPMAWSCLAGGRVFDQSDEAARRLRQAALAVGEELGGAGIDQVLMAWVLALPSKPLPIVGSGQMERVASAIDSMALTLSREQWFRLLEAAQGTEVP